MDKTHDMTPMPAHTKNPLSYVLIALGVLLLVLGVPVLFATSEVSRIVGDAMGQSAMLVIMGLLVVVSGASMLAIGLRKR